MAIELITYANKTVTPMNDAIVRDVEMGASGILYGCEPTYSGNVITIGSGYGFIKGRLFKVTQTRLTVELSSSTLYVDVKITLNLSNTSTPISFVVGRSSAPVVAIDSGEDDANYTDGYYSLFLAEFTSTSTEITGVYRKGKMLPYKKPTVFISPESLGLTSPASVSDIFDAMPRNSIAYIPSSAVASSSLPGDASAGGILEICKVDSGASTSGRSITYKQGKSGQDARMYIDTYGNPTESWWSIPKESDIFYQSGELDTLTCQGGGFITASNTSIRFFVNFSKLKKSSTNVAFVDGTLIARENSKYIAGDSNGSFLLDSGNTTITVKNNGIMVNVVESAGFDNATNNSPVGIYANITVRFS